MSGNSALIGEGGDPQNNLPLIGLDLSDLHPLAQGKKWAT